jgi:hypothetical protein
VLWLGVYNVTLNEAERRIEAGTAALLINTGPILIAPTLAAEASTAGSAAIGWTI